MNPVTEREACQLAADMACQGVLLPMPGSPVEGWHRLGPFAENARVHAYLLQLIYAERDVTRKAQMCAALATLPHPALQVVLDLVCTHYSLAAELPHLQRECDTAALRVLAQLEDHDFLRACILLAPRLPAPESFEDPRRRLACRLAQRWGTRLLATAHPVLWEACELVVAAAPLADEVFLALAGDIARLGADPLELARTARDALVAI